MVEFEEWVNQFEVKEVNGETYVTVYREENELTEHVYTIAEPNLDQMFGDVIEDAADFDSIDKSRLKDRSDPHPDQFGELQQNDWGYGKIIEFWENEDII